MTGTPAARASAIAGCAGGTPGLSTIRSAPSSVWGRCPPSSSSTPASRSCASSAIVSRMSVSVTVAPRRTSSSAAATPLLAAPTTTTRLPDDGERRVRRHRSFKVVRLNSAKMIARMTNRVMTFGSLQPMSSKWWCSGAMRKTRLPVSLNDADLEDDRRGLDHEDAADDDEDEFLLDEERDGAERAAERERADVAHEDVGGIRVVPEEPEARADQRAAEDRQLADQRRHRGSWQVLGEHAMAADVGQRGERRRRDAEHADRQAVETVGEVDRVGPGDADERREQDVDPAEIGNEAA